MSRPRFLASLGGLALVAVVVFGFFLNAAVRLPCYDVCGSDIGRLYQDRGIDRAHPPYFSRDLEYPPLIGEVMYAATVPFDHGLRGPFLVNMLILTGLAVATTWVLWRRNGARAWRWALAPPLLLQGLTNWDLLSVAPATIGLVQWEQGAALAGGALLGVGAAAKLYPALFVPILAAASLGCGASRRAARVVVGAALGFGAVVLPVYAFKPSALHYLATFHGNRDADRGSVWYWATHGPGLNAWTNEHALVHVITILPTLALAATVAALCLASYRRRVSPITACALATIVCLLTSKIYSPQYDLWIVPFLVMLPVRRTLVVRFYIASCAVFVLTAIDHHVWERPTSGIVLGLAVLWRVVVLVRIGLELWRADQSPPDAVIDLVAAEAAEAPDAERAPRAR